MYSTWPTDQLNNSGQTKSSEKMEKLEQSNKLNKNIPIAKTIEAFTPNPNFYPFKYTYFKKMFQTSFCFQNRSSIIFAKPEKNSFALENRLTRKWPKN